MKVFGDSMVPAKARGHKLSLVLLLSLGGSLNPGSRLKNVKLLKFFTTVASSNS